MRNIQLVVLLCACLPCLVFGQMNEGRLLTKNQYHEIQYSETDKVITLDVVLKGSTKKFMLDTGAPVFISDSLQELYNFPVLHKAKLEDATGKKSEILIVRIDTLRVGSFVFVDLPALVLNYKNSPHQCDDFVGNFGSNALRFLIVRFDVQAQQVALSDNIQLLNARAPSTFKPASINQQSDIFFPVQINNQFVDTVHFDSGDGYLYHMSKKAIALLSTLYPKQVIRNGYGVTSMGSLGLPENSEQVVVKPDVITIHNSFITKGLIYITERTVSRIGRYLLNSGVLTLDYVHKQYAFEKYDRPVLPSRFDFGFIPITEGKKVIAGTVWEGSEASKKGLESGDEILSINGVYFGDLSLCDVEPAVKRSLSSSIIEAKFRKKNGTERKVSLRKSSLIN